jgi:polyphosphate glucokinase
MSSAPKNKPDVVLGIDVGGTGIKGALVHAKRGKLASERHRFRTPQPATPEAIAAAVATTVGHFNWTGSVGVTLPGLVRRGVVETAANLDPAWAGVDAQALLSGASGLPTTILNDADAAGLAEVRFGAGRGHEGTVIVLTLGTGIGSSLFIDGCLVPNTEFGHLELGGIILEQRASNVVRKREDLTWEAWAARVQDVLDHLEFVLAPDLFIIGGGVSRPQRWRKFSHLLRPRAEILPAKLQNEAGLIGAAWAARNYAGPPRAAAR